MTPNRLCIRCGAPLREDGSCSKTERTRKRKLSRPLPDNAFQSGNEDEGVTYTSGWRVNSEGGCDLDEEDET